jgi:hypothetical protein
VEVILVRNDGLLGEDRPVHVSAVAAGGDAATSAGHHEREVAEHHAAVAALHARARRARQRRRHAEQAATSNDGGGIRNSRAGGVAQLKKESKKDLEGRLLHVVRAAAALHAAVGGDGVGPVRHGQADVRRVGRERRGAG